MVGNIFLAYFWEQNIFFFNVQRSNNKIGWKDWSIPYVEIIISHAEILEFEIILRLN